MCIRDRFYSSLMENIECSCGPKHIVLHTHAKTFKLHVRTRNRSLLARHACHFYLIQVEEVLLVQERSPSQPHPLSKPPLWNHLLCNHERSSPILYGSYSRSFLHTLPSLLVSRNNTGPVSYTHLRAHETPEHLVCRLLLEKKKSIHTNNPLFYFLRHKKQ
eukprot:TRINITY_DN30113_c0_g1_i1.p1 TRINITY_DN30113_c0_g1~~TRINITY_DN30113_c0_g1_i1.p1  ORF type:complete len:161 (+),score=20.41 TRINITY_DN30113_c0_g1_i1:118-600(+)